MVSHLQAQYLCYVIPTSDGRPVFLGETELVVPKALQIGWCKSPPFFCAGSETARDSISDLVKENTELPWHKFEVVMIPTSLHPTMPEITVDIIEIFVDDFIGTTNNADITHLFHLSRCMLHGIHVIYLHSEITQHGGGDSVLENKLNREDGTWEHKK